MLDVVYFDSQALPKSFDTTVSLQEDLEKVFLKVDTKGVHIQKEAILNIDVLKDMTHLLQERLGLTFFGFDVLLESNTNRYYIVDVNYFPSKFPIYQ
jgi:inositol-1,3,4-trisphosphate 5/6-kinase/inositol-tetrakisphosphate 1-kinase